MKVACVGLVLHSLLLGLYSLNAPFLRVSKSRVWRKVKLQATASCVGSDTGSALDIRGVSLSIGSNNLISDINWSLMPKERWALVGHNGCGKSTLLKALTNSATSIASLGGGSISVKRKSRVGYLEQKGVSGSRKTVWEEVSAGMDRLQLATEALERIEHRVSNGDCSDEALAELEEANAEFDRAGGFTADQQVTTVLQGLGFRPSDHDRLCSEFSGGWQMRIALARLLLSDPDLMLLDEPTNHLDKGARAWLGDYLASYIGTLLLVSHDESLLQQAVNSIAEVRNGKIELYKSRSHKQWLVEREERVKAAQALYDANQREIARLQAYVDRFGAKTMGASLAQSKLKEIAKLEASTPEAPVAHDGPSAHLKLPTPPRGSQILLELRDAQLAWPTTTQATDSFKLSGASQPAKTILRDCNIVVERGMRIAVRGPNGAGKSTLLSALSGKLSPASGSRIEGDGLALGVFTQDLAQDLDQTARAVDVVTSTVRQFDPSLTDERARGALGSLGLVKDKALRLVGQLSGGEKARVALASFMLIPHNLLLLDEPSNHLDVGTVRVLTKALRDFPGAVLVISHDRQLLEELQPTHVVSVREGRVRMEARGLRDSDWEE